jgi:bacteriorhodopsin
MLFSDFLQIIAVLLEVGVTVIAAVIATRHQKSYGWCIAATFGLFVLFDIGRLFALPISDEAHALIFLVACGSMMFGVWLMYKELAVPVHPRD